MKIIQRIVMMALLMLSLTAMAQTPVVLNGDRQPASLQLTGQSSQGLDLKVSTGPIELIPVKNTLGTFVRIQAQGLVKQGQPGTPELPVFSRLIEVPLGAEVEIIAGEVNTGTFNLPVKGYPYQVIPAQASQPKCGDPITLEYNAESYRHFRQQQSVSITDLGILRNMRLIRLTVAPFSYDPVTGDITVIEDMTFSLRYKNADWSATHELKARTASPYYNTLADRLLAKVPVESGRDEIVTVPIVYVIVSDPMFKGELTDFIAWKRRKGFTVIEAYTDVIGATTTAIKAYLQGLYNNGTPEQPAPSFVLFVGDVGEIPAYNNGNGATDRNYVEYTGDLFPEIYYGRFSAQNLTQLQPYLDKTLMVEQYTMPSTSYLDTVVMVAGADATYAPDWGNGQINYGTINYFNDDHGIFSHTYLYPQGGGASGQIIQNVSDGVAFGNYTAHCSPSGWADPSFTQGDIPTLQNANKYGLLIGNCCSSSEYQTSCFAEDIVRAANKGCVGYIGASNSTYWDEDYYFGVGVGTISQNPPSYEETGLGNYDRAFHDHGEPQTDWYTTMDQHVFAGNLAVSESGSSRQEYYWDIYNLIGDPSLMIYYSEPDPMPVTHEPFIMVGSDMFELTTAPYALVTLNRNGDRLSTVMADANGEAVLTFEAITTPGWAELVITAQNYQPLIENVQVFAPDGPYCIYETHEVSDDSLGNNNHHADYNEQVFLSVTLNNYGNANAESVMAQLQTTSSDATILEGQAAYGTLVTNTPSTVEKGFLIQMSDHVADQALIPMVLTATDQQDSTWQSEFTVKAYAPTITPGAITVIDNVGGNGNGRLDPGETAILKFAITNTGHANISQVITSLQAFNPYITVLSGDTILPNLTTFGACYPQFEVEVADNVPEGLFGEMHLDLQAAGYHIIRAYYPRIGLLVEDWETGNFNKFDWEQDGDLPWGINNLYPFEGFHDVRSGAIGSNQTSEFMITYQVMAADTIAFQKKVSSEPDFDKLKFYIDNTLMDSWSGTSQGWTRVAYPVTAGNHTFRWSYQKDFSGTAGSDCAWIDYITLPTMMATTVYAGPDAQVCEGNEYACTATATNYTSMQWGTTGTGSFDFPSTPDPYYTPSEADIQAGAVELYLSIVDVDGQEASDTLLLTIVLAPEIPLMPEGPDQIDLNLTSQSSYNVLPVTGAQSYQWHLYPMEAGVINGTSATATAYWNTSYEGQAWVSVASVSACGVGEFSDSLLVELANPVGIGQDKPVVSTLVRPNPNKGVFTIDIQHPGMTRIRLTLTDATGVPVMKSTTEIFSDQYSRQFNLIDFPAGIYFMVIQTDESREVKKIMIN